MTSARQPHIVILAATFYRDIADALLAGAQAVLKREGVTYDVVEVPGALEIPTALAMAIDTGRFDGAVALGCVIRGETTHYDYVCLESARGINELAIAHRFPLGNGILTVENDDQAWERANVERKNKGGAVAEACLAMWRIKREVLA